MKIPLPHTIAAGVILLTGMWDVFCNGHKIGCCQVSREGLYYRFVCQCSVKFDKVCCLYINIATQRENLGVLVPVGQGFGLNTKLPVKRFGEGTPQFSASEKNPKERGVFIPVYPDEPFSYLSRVADSYLARRGEQIGILIKQENS